MSTATLDLPSAIAFGAAMQAIDGAPLDLGPRDRRLQAEAIEAVGLLHERGALLGGAANLAIRLDDAPGHVLITARGLPRDLGPADFGVVDERGGFVAGWLGKGIRSVIGMHLAALRRPGVRMSIHSHSPYATAFAVAHRAIPPHYEPLYNRGQQVEIPVTQFGERDNGDLVAQIETLLDAHPRTRAVLLANHGVLAFHDSVPQAAELLGAINDAACTLIHAQALGGSRPMAR